MEKRQCPKCGARLSKTARCCVECGEFLETLPAYTSSAPSREAISLAQTEDFNNRIRRVLGSDQAQPKPAADSAFDDTPAATCAETDFFPDTENKNKNKKNKTKQKNEKDDKAKAKADKEIMTLPGLMGLQLLFFIPVIGLIAAILFASYTKNPAVKMLARSRIVWSIIIVSIIVVFVAVYELWLRNFLITHDLGLWEFSMSGAKTILDLRDLTLTKLFG